MNLYPVSFHRLVEDVKHAITIGASEGFEFGRRRNSFSYWIETKYFLLLPAKSFLKCLTPFEINRIRLTLV